MYLLDTNHCSDILRGRSGVTSRLANVDLKIATTVITMGELILMGEKSRDREENIKTINNFLAALDILHIDADVARIYGKVKSDLFKTFGPKKENGKLKKIKLHQIGISDNDLWIACMAINVRAVLLTNDGDFEKIKQVSALTTESWI
jgi:tRNA(fMet)-specific endonuclease VapC